MKGKKKRPEKGQDELSAQVLQIREQLGLTQRELAKHLGVSAAAVAHWELGSRPISEPTFRLLKLLQRDGATKK